MEPEVLFWLLLGGTAVFLIHKLFKKLLGKKRRVKRSPEEEAAYQAYWQKMDEKHAGERKARSLYEQGKELRKDKTRYAEALQCFEEALSLGHTAARLPLADMYHLGEGVAADQEKAAAMAMDMIAEKEQKGETPPLALYELLGDIYSTDGWKGKDISKAIQYYEKCSDGDNYAAACVKERLAELYQGQGNVVQSLTWYEKLARQDCIVDNISLKASRIVGKAYDQGLGVPVDRKKAYEYYSIYAHSPSKDLDKDEYFRLFEMCKDGIGTKIHIVNAYEFLQRASKYGHPVALRLMGVSKLMTYASFYPCSNYLTYAAEAGDGLAMLALACYLSKSDDTKEQVKAQEWYAKAARCGVYGKPTLARLLGTDNYRDVEPTTEGLSRNYLRPEDSRLLAVLLNNHPSDKSGRLLFRWLCQLISWPEHASLENLRIVFNSDLSELCALESKLYEVPRLVDDDDD